MTTPTGLTKAAGVATAIGGAIFVGVQIGHPPMTVETVTTADWMVRSIAKTVMGALLLWGLTGIFVRQRREAGVLGLIGYVVFFAGYVMLTATEVIAFAVLPALADANSAYVQDVLDAAGGGTAAGDIGALEPLLAASGIFYLLGGVLMGAAIFRAAVLQRWSGILLAAGALGTLALAVLPESFNRPMAVPIGLAFVWIGVSLFQRARADLPRADHEGRSVSARA